MKDNKKRLFILIASILIMGIGVYSCSSLMQDRLQEMMRYLLKSMEKCMKLP